ncbi:MAG: hypothetical protein ABIO48_00250 [Pedococcus sp.]
MSTRLEQVHPDVTARFRSVPPDLQRELVRHVALEAVRKTGLSVPPEGTDLTEWSTALDSRGWSLDAEGEPLQAEADFARARAAFALRDATLGGSRTDAAEDCLYESIAALRLDVVRELLGPAT